METYIDFDEPYTSDVFDDVDPLLEVEELPKEISYLKKSKKNLKRKKNLIY